MAEGWSRVDFHTLAHNVRYIANRSFEYFQEQLHQENDIEFHWGTACIERLGKGMQPVLLLCHDLLWIPYFLPGSCWQLDNKRCLTHFFPLLSHLPNSLLSEYLKKQTMPLKSSKINCVWKLMSKAKSKKLIKHRISILINQNDHFTFFIYEKRRIEFTDQGLERFWNLALRLRMQNTFAIL